MPWLLLMIYCLKCERCFGGCLSFKTLSRSPLLAEGSALCLQAPFSLHKMLLLAGTGGNKKWDRHLI